MFWFGGVMLCIQMILSTYIQKKKNNKKSTYLMYMLSKFTNFTMYCKYNEKPYTDPKG